MPKGSKSKTDALSLAQPADLSLTSASALVASLATSSAPAVVEKKVKKTKAVKVEPTDSSVVASASTSSSSSVPVVSSTVDAPVLASVDAVVDAPESAVSGEVVDTTDLVKQQGDFLVRINELTTLLAALKNEYRSLEKKWTREIKVAQKSQSKRRKSGNRAPSGFVKPTKISDALAKFLEKPAGTEMARTHVTKEINSYIRAHNLQDKDNGRKIIPDAKLTRLLNIQPGEDLTYFNLQKFMSPHFTKMEKKVPTTI
jgi:SWIB/MDM2 domain